MNLSRYVLCVAIAGILGGCATPLQRYSASVPAVARLPLFATSIVDGRASFRSIFCAAVKRDSVPADDGCAVWLHRLSDEAASETLPVLESPRVAYDLLVVPGIFGECVSNQVAIFGDATAHLARFGYRSSVVPVRGRASSEHNATIIRDYVLKVAAERPGRRFILVAYSKGTPDSMVALVTYPEMRPHVAALISFAGVVNGTPIAEGIEDLYERSAGILPYASCDVVDHGEIRSLTPAVRMGWLASHAMPADIASFSVVAMPAPDRVSAILRPLHTLLSTVDPRNDSQVIYFDAIVPGSTLLGFVNADHWAVALPFETQVPALAGALVDQNRFPRQQLLEAAVRVAEERMQREAASRNAPAK